MKRLVTSAEMATLDRFAADSLGLPVSVLMENAGAALARQALALSPSAGRFVVVCGPGNNGGDGLVAARKLAGQGRVVLVEVTSETMKGEPKRNLDALLEAGIKPGHIVSSAEIGSGDVVIDALFGTGLSRPPEGPQAKAIQQINEWKNAGAKVLAADIPSGLQSDTGIPFSPHVEADVTVSFAFPKVGQLLEPGASICGKLLVEDIGIPASALSSLSGPPIELLEESDIRDRIPVRASNSHKGTYGHLLIISGSWGKSGAGTLCGSAALRSGVGLVTIATRPEALVPVMQPVSEMMGVELVGHGGLGLGDLKSVLTAANGKQAIVIGPGIPRGADTGHLLGALLKELAVPCLLDADALNALEGNLKLIQRAKCPLLLTPHPGEAARLLSKSTAEIQGDRVAAARAIATTQQVVVILKGARSLIGTEDGTVYVNPTGNPGLATGGTGDVLAGMCGAFLAQGFSADNAAVVAIYAHGLSADLQVQKFGQLGLIASDVVRGLGKVWTRWGR